jgi:hypothetical protein
MKNAICSIFLQLLVNSDVWVLMNTQLEWESNKWIKNCDGKFFVTDGRRWAHNILSDLKEVYFLNMNWILLAQQMNFMLVVLNLQFLMLTQAVSKLAG